MHLFWHLQQSLHIIIWIFLIYQGMTVQVQEGWYGLVLFALLQILQYFLFSSKIGEERGYSKGQSLVMTLLFGYSWWYPLRRGTGTS